MTDEQAGRPGARRVAASAAARSRYGWRSWSSRDQPDRADAGPAAGPAADSRPGRARGQALLLGALGIAVCLGLWQLLTQSGAISTLGVPTMTSTVAELGTVLITNGLWLAVAQTLEGVALGFAVGSVGGVLLGTVIGLSDTAFASTFVVIEFLKTIPVIAVLPLAVLLFGTTLKMKVTLVTFGVFFPMIIQTIYGVRSVDPVIRDTARVYGLRPWDRFVSVILPSAAPYIATGLRLGVTGALLLDIVAEISAGGSGLGLQILEGQSGGALPYTYALLVVTGSVGVVLVVGLSALERRLMSWHEAYRQSETR